MSLKSYKKKRNFGKTPEPKATEKTQRTKKLAFVVQEHHASRLHYDFRLELDGVLKSWAVPKGPSMDPSVKHLAVKVEDHPFAYRKFHGTIPKGNYGAGTVSIWDEGTYEPFEQGNDPEKILRVGLKKGELKFILHGKKLTGKFALVKFGHEEDNWLLIKEKDTSVSFVSSEKSTKGKKTSMPHNIFPMLAKLADSPFDDTNWVYEIKWDGYRAIAELEKGHVRLYSRNDQDFTKTYSEIVSALQSLKANAVLDGEIVATDAKGKPSFQQLQQYTKKKDAIKLTYYVFDLLYLNGYDLRQLPLLQRKELLKKLLQENQYLKYNDHIDTYGVKAFNFAKKKELEGIMAKRKDSTYLSMRSSSWLKFKNIRMQEAIICGFTEPRGQRKEFGALILGIYDNGELRYIGHTGGGFDETKLKEIITLLKPLSIKKSPFAVIPQTNASATWVKPKKICQVKFSEWTSDGVMRQPIFIGLRNDKKPEEVTQEMPVTTKGDIKKGKGQLSNFDKVFWPKEGYTKGDVISYYDHISSYILPYLKDRAESLNRHPDGIEGISFYQKDITTAPTFIKTVPLYSESEKKIIHWLVCNDRDTLLYMANLGCIELNPWSSRIKKTDYPDYLIIDLDPNGADFKEVITTALTVKKVMDRVNIDCFIKTSGKTGLHILVPLGAQYTFDQTRKFAQLLASIVQKQLPDTTSIVRDPQERKKKVYIDYLQNRIGQTITAPYSLRPVPGAQVSTPLQWNELTTSLHPSNFTIKTIFKRLEKKGDIWKGFLSHKGIAMLKSLDMLTKAFGED